MLHLLIDIFRCNFRFRQEVAVHIGYLAIIPGDLEPAAGVTHGVAIIAVEHGADDGRIRRRAAADIHPGVRRPEAAGISLKFSCGRRRNRAAAVRRQISRDFRRAVFFRRDIVVGQQVTENKAFKAILETHFRPGTIGFEFGDHITGMDFRQDF